MPADQQLKRWVIMKGGISVNLDGLSKIIPGSSFVTPSADSAKSVYLYHLIPAISNGAGLSPNNLQKFTYNTQAEADSVNEKLIDLLITSELATDLDSPDDVTITSLSPATVSSSGAMQMKIIGTGFQAGAKIFIDSIECEIVGAITDTLITVITPTLDTADSPFDLTYADDSGNLESDVGGVAYANPAPTSAEVLNSDTASTTFVAGSPDYQSIIVRGTLMTTNGRITIGTIPNDLPCTVQSVAVDGTYFVATTPLFVPVDTYDVNYKDDNGNTVTLAAEIDFA